MVCGNSLQWRGGHHRAGRAQRIGGLVLSALVLFGGSVGGANANAVERSVEQAQTRLIVQGRDLPAAKAAVIAVGGEVSQELKIIRAVVAHLSSAQRRQIEVDAGVHRVWTDVRGQVRVPGKPAAEH